MMVVYSVYTHERLFIPDSNNINIKIVIIIFVCVCFLQEKKNSR